MKDMLMDNKFLSQVRVPRIIIDDYETGKFRAIMHWAERVARIAKEDHPINIFAPTAGGNRIVISGEDRQTFLASNLIRKLVIEISNDTFDSELMYDFVVQAKEQFKIDNTPKVLPSARVDFKIAVADMSRRQADSYERMVEMLSKTGVTVTATENKPTFITLTAPDDDTLKTVTLTAQWAAKEMETTSRLSARKIADVFMEKAVIALGRQKGREFAELALA